LLFLKGTGKRGVFKQVDYLSQLLMLYINVTVTCYIKRLKDAIGARQLLVRTRDSIGYVIDP
jgi:hypothetical protein